MLSFSKFEFKWSVHVIDALYPYLIFLLFPMIYLYHGSEKCRKLSHTTINIYGYMDNEISIAMHT